MRYSNIPNNPYIRRQIASRQIAIQERAYNRRRAQGKFLIALASFILFVLFILVSRMNELPSQSSGISGSASARPPVDQVGTVANAIPTNSGVTKPSNQELQVYLTQANQAFIRARREASIDPLQGYATDIWLQNEIAEVASLQQANQRELWQQESLSISQVIQRDDQLLVCTQELWRKHQIDSANNLGIAKEELHHERYILVAIKGKWMISNIEYNAFCTVA